jgi:Uma2 family endonuclease
MAPTPTWFHQSLAMLLGTRLHESCPAEFRVTQAVEVRISTLRTLIPDVLVVTAAAIDRKPHRFLPEDVMLAIEIVSPTSVSMDRVMKPALYAEADIPYYWRIETADGIQVHTYKLDPVASVYRENGSHDATIETDEPWAISIPIAEFSPR